MHSAVRQTPQKPNFYRRAGACVEAGRTTCPAMGQQAGSPPMLPLAPAGVPPLNRPRPAWQLPLLAAPPRCRGARQQRPPGPARAPAARSCALPPPRLQLPAMANKRAGVSAQEWCCPQQPRGGKRALHCLCSQPYLLPKGCQRALLGCPCRRQFFAPPLHFMQCCARLSQRRARILHIARQRR